ncbi:MAG TPA: outer membrane protein assembly factor BamD [Nitrospiraceae bacterium]|nr:outer membrane protein assembly factor BamD [Nitrospiraceae bacterium]
MLKKRMPHRLSFFFLCVVLAATLWLLGACSSTPKSQPSDKKPLSGTDEQIFLGDTIEKNYDPNVIMKRGEAFFDKEEFPEAIVEYQHFLDLHRNHMLAPYAQFRLGESHLRIARSIDRDPDPIHKAIAAFERLRKEFPGSRYEGQALQRLDECHDWLAQTHLFVGQFYYRRDSFLAAAHRFDQIMKEYPDKSVAPEALYYLALSYKEMGANDWASEKLTLLAEKYPNSEAAKDGKKLLAKLQKTIPSTVVAQSPQPAPPPASVEPASTEPAPTLFADSRRPSPIPVQPSISVPPTQASALSGNTGASLTQRFVSCRLGAWC